MKIKINNIISDGLVYAKTEKICEIQEEHSKYSFDTQSEIEALNKAINKSITDLDELKNKVDNNDKEFIEVHKMLISDPILYNEIVDNIKNNGLTKEYAFNKVIDSYIEKFSLARTTYLKERILDMEDIRIRVMSNFKEHNKVKIDGKFILVIDELYPSLLMTYNEQIVGVIAKRGGMTSHSAILCKGREIPYVLIDDLNIIEGFVLIDTREGILDLNPSTDKIEEANSLNEKKENFVINDFSSFGIKELANVTNNLDLKKVIDYNMDGVGLYRTELIFMNLDRAMTYDEQYKIYSEAINLMKTKPICFRTFDIGDDKQLEYIKSFKKGIDNYINNKEIFENQVKALIKANKYNNMKIMFPMIETYDEFLYLKEWVLKIKKGLNDNSYLEIGMMLETKKALENIKDFKDVSFISLGTNDLTSELFNLKREETINYKEYIKDLLDKLSIVVAHANKYNICLSICGELAGIKSVVKRLYRLGIKNFSVSVANVRNLNQALLEELEE